MTFHDWLLLHNFIQSTHLKVEPSALSRARRAGRYIKDRSADTIYSLLSRRDANTIHPWHRRRRSFFSRRVCILFYSARRNSRARSREDREGIRGRRGGCRVLIKGVRREESLSLLPLGRSSGVVPRLECTGMNGTR